MSRQYCFLCASDEGVFLVVTPDNCNIFNNQLETCLTTKVSECIELSNNICYKCAYELDQCTKFVEKYKKSHEIAQPKAKPSEPYCYLCFEFVENDRVFDITKDNRAIFHPLQKVRNIFNEDLSKKDSYSRLVCLTCRYNLDVLYDLKRVYHEAVINLKALINKEIDYANFPKVHTDVINRKTTVTTFPDITFYGLVNSDTESNEDMARNNKSRVKTRNSAKKLRNDVKTKDRICNHCHNSVANGIDMYRFHRTGLTVCKSCWLTIDPTKGRNKGKKQLRKTAPDSFVETKLCSVFLTDVLSEESHKSEKVYRVEKDKDGNKFYIISDESSLEEDKSSDNSRLTISSKLENRVNGDAQQGKKRRINIAKSDIESSPTKVTRSNQKCTNINEIKTAKLLSDAEEQSMQQRHKRTRSVNESSDSDVPLKTVLKMRKLSNSRLPSSSAEGASNQDRKKLRSILKGITTNVRVELSDQSSNEDSKTLRRKTRNASILSNAKEVRKEICTRTRSSSISSIEILSSSEFKNPKVVALSEMTAEYICDECNKEFDTKLSREEHKLTHLKQAVLKLERITVLSEQKEQETEVDSQDDKIFKETEACSSRIISIDKNADDLSEEIAINVDDDTDDEEILNFGKSSESVQQKVKKVMDDKSDNETNELDTTEGKLCIEEESAKIINEDVITKDSQQCEESAIVSDEAVTSVEVQDDQDVKKENTDTSKDTDAESQEAIITTVGNQKNLDMVEENAKIENNTKESANEKSKKSGKSVDRCDNEKKNVHDDTTAESTVNTIEDDENYNETYKNDVKKCEVDEETADVEIEQCNSTNKSVKKDKKLEEEENTILDVTDETEILDDKGNVENMITTDENKAEALKKQQNRTDEWNMETEVIDVDKTNNDVKNKLTFSNCEKLDEAKDDKEEDNVAVIANSNDDAVKSKETIEEITTNNSNMEDTLDDIELIENNVTSNKGKRQEEEEEELLNDANNSSMDAANEILKEVFEFATNEIQNREDSNSAKYLENNETIESVSREACNDADMPSLDPISVMEIDNNDITLN